MNKYQRQLFTLILLWSIQAISFAEVPELTIAKIQEQRTLIQKAATTFDINAKYLSAIIYTERTLNYDWTDEKLDIALAKAGKNSSIGFCQVKLKTAYFIERQLHDPNSVFYLGKQYEHLLPVSQRVEELIQKLDNIQTNLLYAAAYLKMMQTRWAKVGHSIDNRPDILGTLYSTGLYHNDGSERLPHANPKANAFGEHVLKASKLFK